MAWADVLLDGEIPLDLSAFDAPNAKPRVRGFDAHPVVAIGAVVVCPDHDSIVGRYSRQK